MKQRVKDPAFAAVCMLTICGAMNFACSGPPQGGTTFGATPPPSTEPLDPLAPGATVLCPTPSIGSEESGLGLYVVSAMNHKLREYPEFAAAAGLDVVSDCEGANRFFRAHADYSLEHPDFDADETLAPMSEDEPAPPSYEPDDQPETSKITNAPFATNNPVVQIIFATCQEKGCPAATPQWRIPSPSGIVDWRNTTFACSGTFIAKNWILTSAHCLNAVSVDKCMEDGFPPSLCKPTWSTYGRWRIRGTFSSTLGGDGVPSGDDARTPYDIKVWARGYMQPNWIGRDFTKNTELCGVEGCDPENLSGDHDLALLYVSPQNDDRLPPRVEENGAKRISKVPVDIGWKMSMAGWGRPGVPGDERPLRQTPPGANPGSLGSISTTAFRVRVFTSTGVYMCPGDSGGALFRTELTMDTNIGRQSNLEALIGVLTAGTGPCDANPIPGTTQTWSATRIDPQSHRDFIKFAMQRWSPWQGKTFDLLARDLVTPAASNQVVEAWGKPCLGDTCPTGQTCWYPPRMVARRTPNCSSCVDFDGTLGDACNCLQGQCLPN